MDDPRRRIPGIDTLLRAPVFGPLVAAAGRGRVVGLLRTVQADLRQDPDAAPDPPTDPAWYAGAVSRLLEAADRPSLRPVINATGVVLHTNLGRAPLADAARRAMAEVAAGYATLEYDLDTGSRGSRHNHCVATLLELTGAEDALVVNNNAAALVLALNTLAEGGEVLVSRGELVEIGGSFRVPDIMGRSGARLREVGATNRTHLHDYQDAAGPDTRLVLKVHRSNFRIEGFTAEVGVETLAAWAHRAGLPLVHDLGSGALLDLTTLGLPPEPTAGQAVDAGADGVTFSGDKLLGGPQAGIIVGRAALVERMRRNPLCRAFRCDKLTLAALGATLALYRDPATARQAIPVLRMLGAAAGELARRAEHVADALRARGVEPTLVEAGSAVGGGACPGVELPTTAIGLAGTDGATALAHRLRAGNPPVVARVRDDTVLLDLRTVEPDEEATLVDCVVAAVAAFRVDTPGDPA
jgi:L-seryl-tRNA(Ser) seleniumtransferase